MYDPDLWKAPELKSASQFSWLLADINEELSRRELRGDVYLVGEAAMLFPYDARPRGLDCVEAILAPRSELLEIAEIVTAGTFLEDDWLRDSPRKLSDIQCRALIPIVQYDYLTVWHPGDRRMVAIKFLEAFRSEEAAHDAMFPMGRMGISSKEDLLAIVSESFPEWRATQMHDYLARVLLERMHKNEEPPSH